MAQLRPGESFGKLSFRLDGLHTRRNASVLSDGSGEALPILSSGASSGGDDDDVNDDDACVLLLVLEQSYMSTRDKIDLIQPIFRHWAMDRLVELACAMKKKSFEGGDKIVRQGERVDHVWMIKNGIVRILHNMLPPTRIEARDKAAQGTDQRRYCGSQSKGGHRLDRMHRVVHEDESDRGSRFDKELGFLRSVMHRSELNLACKYFSSF